jgi:hypothetical protein
VNRHRWFLGILAMLGLTLAGFIVEGRARSGAYERTRMPQLRKLVSILGLTDFSIWTEARYTRHPSQADFFTPFQNFPGALEQFPAGSVISPPPHLHGAPVLEP